ncbi:MAG: DUF554 domain-containing protein [Clostridia bacterium]
MIGVLVNVGAIALGTGLGLCFKKILTEHTRVVVMQGMGVAVLFVGIADVVKTPNFLILILALAFGGFIGAACKIEERIDKVGAFLERKFARDENDKVGTAFVSATLIFCIGAMAIYGSIEAGLGNNSTLFTKSILDGVMAILLAATYGWGVVLSAIPLLILQGGVALMAGFIEPIATPLFMSQLSGIGGALVFCIGINILGIKKIHTADLLPAILGAFAVFLM